MKPHSYFIAVSRGGIYAMDGLVKALDSKRLDGAGADVTDPEPLPKGHPPVEVRQRDCHPACGRTLRPWSGAQVRHD